MNFLSCLTGVFQSAPLLTASCGFLTSFSLSWLLVGTKHLHGRVTLDQVNGIQKFHAEPTPRIGGISILLSLVLVWLMAPLDIRQLLGPVLLAGLPAFLVGILEDMTKRVPVLHRLLATMASGLVGLWLTGYSLTHVDVWGVNWLLQFGLVSALFTAIAVGGVANSINIIDGFNGLSSLASSLAFLGYAMIAWQAGDMQLAGAALVLGASVFGFFWVNWPMGKLFLGDGGAYFVGFSLAWVAVMLLERNAGVSAFAALMVLTHPVIEVLFSMYRRKIKKQSATHADRLHFHSIVQLRYVRRFLCNRSLKLRNSVTGLLVGSMTAVSIVLANLTWQSVWLSVFCLLALVTAYLAVYARMVRFRWFWLKGGNTVNAPRPLVVVDETGYLQ
jgi:UDP-N-acetylmuramyl pentapeptide phosphotransferase/UDP-N-acetylglucosamine-1-phosphate transferase